MNYITSDGGAQGKDSEPQSDNEGSDADVGKDIMEAVEESREGQHSKEEQDFEQEHTSEK